MLGQRAGEKTAATLVTAVIEERFRLANNRNQLARAGHIGTLPITPEIEISEAIAE